MTTIPTDLPFWGHRPYLQSAQLIEAFREALPALGIGPCEKASIKFRSFLRTQGEFFLADADTPAHACEGEFSLQTEGGKITVGLRAVDRAVADTTPDDEQQLIAGCSIDADAQQGHVSGYDSSRFFAVLVALNKKLILDTLGPEDGKAWILAKLDLQRPFERTDGPDLTCTVRSVIADKMVNTHIILNNETVGSTVFTKVDKP